MQLAPRGIRVNAVAPGPVATPIATHQGLDAGEAAALAARLIAHVPLGRIGAGLTLDDVTHFRACLDGDLASAPPAGPQLAVARRRLARCRGAPIPLP